MILQAHPGWGKTACLGASLFLLETEGSRISDKTIWVGTLQEVYDFVFHMDNPKEVIMIVDDFHNQRTINGKKLSVNEMHEIALEISDRVGSLIVTCQIDPMNGQVWNESPAIAASSACKVFENFMPHESQHEEFIRGLLLKTDCIKPQRKERDGTIIIQPDELQSVAITIFSQHLKEKIFSDNNIQYSGQYYSPRIAIRKLQQAKREFDNPKNKDKNIRSYEFFKEIFDNDKGGLGRLEVCDMPLSEKELCNLHIALSDMLPLPEQLIQFVVNGLFNIENWEATDDDGFYVDNIKADDLDLEESQFYVYQSQIWSQLSQNEYGDLDDDESKSNYQNKFNSHKDEEIISSIIQKIQDCRFDTLSKFSVDTKPETLVDALLNIDLEYRNEEDLPELHAGTVSIISGIEDLAEAYQFGILLAMLNQIELVPTGPLVKIRKKEAGKQNLGLHTRRSKIKIHIDRAHFQTNPR